MDSTFEESEHKTIFLVDDSRTILETGKNVLKDKYKVFPFLSANIMFDLLQRIVPDLILLDIEMPDMNGYEVIKHLKNNPQWTEIPVIFLTARTDAGSELEGLRLGAIDYVTKPFSPPILLKRIGNHLFIEMQRKQLKESNIKLEKLVRERTRELEEKTHAAQAASEAKSRFLTSMSHEIRTPLNAIMGMAQVAKKTESKLKSDISVDQIHAASTHLLGILNDILDMSNIESGTLEIKRDRFTLNRVALDTVSIIGHHCCEKGITFTHNADTLPRLTLLGDKQRIRQVLINLLENAVKFTPEDGKVDLTIRIEQETDNHAVVFFTIKDSGIGISYEQQEKIFAAFEQGSINSMKHGGTGLGLPISQELVNMMGGEIKCESTLNKGSTFSFSINFEKVLGKAEGNEDSSINEIPDLSGKHILIVEDIEINRIVLQELLSETNAAIEEAFDGVEALEKFKASPEGYYDFIFMDILMPNMNGYDAARNIRSLKRADAAKVPIAALSANAYETDVAKALEAGMNDHLAKPIDFAALVQVLTDNIE
jgi:signal transduction histidine kinase